MLDIAKLGKFMRVFVAFLVILISVPAFAGPEGKYTVEGSNPGGGSVYQGTVAVERNGQTYSVVWDVGGTKYVGTGLGAANVKGTPTMGPASEQDNAIAISYVSNGTFGLTFYVEQENGQWKGIWTFGGSSQIGTEIWTPAN